MTYDADAKKLAVKVIGTVESNLDYEAVNFADPITVGVAQWFGTRAAAILMEMRSTGEWWGVAGSLDSQLASIASSNTFWNSRYLTLVEGESLYGVLGRCQAIQNARLSTDLDAYVTVFESYGFDADAHTDTLIYFMSMHHQGPAYALDVVETLDTDCTLEQMHAACLANPVLGKYGGRYNTTYNLIHEADVTGVDPTPPPEPPVVVPNGNARTITAAGDLLLVQFADTERVTYYPTGRGQWMPRTATIAPPAPTPEQPPPPPDNGTWVLPLTGSVTMMSGYGPRAFDGLASFHYGVDLANPAGSPGNVVTPCPLVITRAYNVGDSGANGTAGGYVKGHTTDGQYTFNFYHMASGTVNTALVGTTTGTGTVLGTEGSTGNVSGQHLHFEAYAGNFADPWPPPYGQTTDPLPILRAHGVNV